MALMGMLWIEGGASLYGQNSKYFGDSMREPLFGILGRALKSNTAKKPAEGDLLV